MLIPVALILHQHQHLLLLLLLLLLSRRRSASAGSAAAGRRPCLLQLHMRRVCDVLHLLQGGMGGWLARVGGQGGQLPDAP